MCYFFQQVWSTDRSGINIFVIFQFFSFNYSLFIIQMIMYFILNVNTFEQYMVIYTTEKRKKNYVSINQFEYIYTRNTSYNETSWWYTIVQTLISMCTLYQICNLKNKECTGERWCISEISSSQPCPSPIYFSISTMTLNMKKSSCMWKECFMSYQNESE